MENPKSTQVLYIEEKENIQRMYEDQTHLIYFIMAAVTTIFIGTILVIQ